MAADVVERPESAIVAPDDQNRIPIDLVGEVVAGLRHLASVPGEEPRGSPDAVHFDAIEILAREELALERIARPAAGDKVGEGRRNVCALGLHVSMECANTRAKRIQ